MRGQVNEGGHPRPSGTQMHSDALGLSSPLIGTDGLSFTWPLIASQYPSVAITHLLEVLLSDALRCTQMHSDALRCTQMHLLDVLLHRVERGRVPWARSTHERQLLE